MKLNAWGGVASLLRRERGTALALAVVLVNGVLLLPELQISRVDVNDSVLHYTLADRMVQAVERGENPLDFWVSEWTLGYPVPRTYQPLGHAAVTAVYYALGKSVPVMTVFVWMRYLLVALLPLTVYGSARLLELPRGAAAAAALVSPLVATGNLYGIEYGSYVWRGNGLFTQAVAMHLLLWSLGFALRAVRTGVGAATAGLLLGAAFLGHFIYGWMGAVTVAMAALLPVSGVPLRARLRRAAQAGAAAFLVTAFELIPLLGDTPWINRSRWEPAWKWDSFGFAEVMRLLLGGSLFDFGRAPVLTLLAAVGAAVCVLAVRGGRPRGAQLRAPGARAAEAAGPAGGFLLAGMLLWALLLCGREAWGPLLFQVLGAGEQAQLHRVVGGVHLFGILLAGVGLSWLWRLFAARGRAMVAVLGTVPLLLVPAAERVVYLRANADWGLENLAAYRAEGAAAQALLERAAGRPGRFYPGLAAGWGKDLKVGAVPMFNLASMQHIPAVAFLYHAMALTSDVMVRFDERREDHFRLFNIGSVVTGAGRVLASFLVPLEERGRFRLLAAPPSGYFEIITAPYAVRCDRRTFYDANDAWMQSDWVARRQHLRLEFPGDPPAGLPYLAAGVLPAAPDPGPAPGAVEEEARSGEVYSARVRLERDALVLFKMTFHPRWSVTVDGAPAEPFMVSPGFLAVPVPAGRHRIECRYQPEAWKIPLLLGGVAAAALLAAGLFPRSLVRRLADAGQRLRPGGRRPQTLEIQ